MEMANKKNTGKMNYYLPVVWFFLGFGLFMCKSQNLTKQIALSV